MTRNRPELSKSVDYIRLRESIKNCGMLEPLVVNRASTRTRRKLIGGGESRLEILKSLHEETGDPKFLVVDCVARRSPRPLRRILSHEVQNDVRTKKFFIERASSVLHCVQYAQTENGWNKLSQLEAVTFLRDQGLPISPSMYSQMVYAVDRLLPLLPKALHAGWGRPQIERVRVLEKTGQKVWDEFGEFGDSFEELFTEVLKSCDDHSLYINDLRYQLEYELYVSCDLELQAVRHLFDVPKSSLTTTIKILRDFDKNPGTAEPVPRNKPTATAKPRSRSRTRKRVRPVLSRSIPVDRRVTTLAEFNRRRRYARKLALQLAGLSNATRLIKPTDERAIGYSVVPEQRSNSSANRSSVVLSYIKACEALVCDLEPNVQVPPGWFEVTDEEWSLLRDLMDVTRTLKMSLQTKPNSKSDHPEIKDLDKVA